MSSFYVEKFLSSIVLKEQYKEKGLNLKLMLESNYKGLKYFDVLTKKVFDVLLYNEANNFLKASYTSYNQEV